MWGIGADSSDNSSELEWITKKYGDRDLDVLNCGNKVEIPKDSVPSYTVEGIEADCGEVSRIAGGTKVSQNEERVPKLFIRDLLEAKKIIDMFVCNNKRFKYVNICGYVVGKQTTASNYYLQVHDGTGTITCILNVKDFDKLQKPIRHLEKIVRAIDREQNKADTPNNDDDDKEYDGLEASERSRRKEQKKKDLTEAMQLIISSTRCHARTVPSWSELEIGDVVTIIGKLKEHNAKRNIFVDKINKVPPQSHMLWRHLEERAYSSDP